MSEKCGCYFDKCGEDCCNHETEIIFCPLHAHAEEMREACEAVDIYFKALCEQWEANDGRVVSDSGVVINASKDVERLCEIAGMKVATVLAKTQGGKDGPQ